MILGEIIGKARKYEIIIKIDGWPDYHLRGLMCSDYGSLITPKEYIESGMLLRHFEENIKNMVVINDKNKD